MRLPFFIHRTTTINQAKRMNLVANLLILVAMLLSALTVTFLIAWLRGSSAVAFPGLGIVVATPLVIALFLIIEFGVILIAALIKPTANIVGIH